MILFIAKLKHNVNNNNTLRFSIMKNPNFKINKMKIKMRANIKSKKNKGNKFINHRKRKKIQVIPELTSINQNYTIRIKMNITKKNEKQKIKNLICFK